MELQHIALEQLSVSKANMRNSRKPPDISDILPSVKTRGVLVPLLVRPNGEDGHFEIVAGRRRYHAALAAAEGQEIAPPLPCAILSEGDDATAIEASLIENIARQDPDEVTKWETFTRLVKAGRDIDDIAATFGLPKIAVRRILALGNLLPPIREAYRAEEIDPATIRHLTLASKAQQKEWLALFRDKDSYAPRGSQLKAWLFGGASISVSAALFDLASYEGEIVADLFEDNGYFASADQFWTAQQAEIERRRALYLDDGWNAVEIVPPERHFQSWEYERASKRKGGRVYIDVNGRGEVTFHEGHLTRKEAVKRSSQSDTSSPAERSTRPEVTAAMNDYLDRHRHAAVRAALTANTGLALRVMVAHAICGSPLWQVKACDPHSRDAATMDSVANSPAEARMSECRRTLLARLEFDGDEATLVQGYDRFVGIAGVVRRLLALADEAVLDILAMVMAETLATGTELIELLGSELSIDMAEYWTPDTAFFDLIRDREVLTALLAEVAGDAVAHANAGEKTATMKHLIADCLAGENGREQRERWVPRWLTFPPAAYTERGGVAAVTAHNGLQAGNDETEAVTEELREAAE